jgi:hypothetical protein
MFKLRIVNIDQYGYWGRDFHPALSDEGLVVTPLGMDGFHNKDGDCPEPLLEKNREGVDRCADVERGLAQAYHEICWTCVTDDGRTLQLMDHEVEVVDAAHQLVESISQWDGALSPVDENLKQKALKARRS